MSAEPMFVRLKDGRGRRTEAMAFKFHDHTRLPDGQWAVKSEGGAVRVMGESDMPGHWQKQIRRACSAIPVEE